MYKFLTLSLGGAMMMLAGGASAQDAACFNDKGFQIACPAVPEISAIAGSAALAVLAGVMLLMWERRRHAA